jgi:hypothetical protein
VKRRREWRARVLLVLGSIVAATLLFELTVKVLGIDYNLSPNWKYHPVLGWSQVPGAAYDFTLHGRRTHVAFNSLGFRDVEHARAKPPGVKRVVVIGDSFCESVQVNLEETFFKLLEARLNAAGGERWEVINLGVGDFGSAQEWIALDRYGFDYAPDVVVQEIFPLNDICNNTIELRDMCTSPNDRYRPYFVERGRGGGGDGGGLALTQAQPVREFLRRHSAAYGVVEHAVLARRPFDPEVRFALSEPLGFALEPNVAAFVPEPAQHPLIARGWRVTEAILQKTAAACRARGIGYVAFVAPFDDMLVEPARYAAQFAEIRDQPVVDYPEQRLTRFFARIGVPSVALRDEFMRRPNEALPFIDGHFGLGAHRLTAALLHAKLVEAGLAR